MRRIAATTAVAACALVAAAEASAQPGAVDVDVRAASGGLLGDLHGHIASNGHGLGTFRPAPGVPRLALTVGLHDRRSAVIVHGGKLHVALKVGRNGRLKGSGKLGHTRVRAAGVGGERLPDLRKGMRMLVVGKPAGEGYAALKRLFRPVRYRPRQHTRHRFLRERREFRSYAALVFGKDVPPEGIQSHRLLHAFYGAGKWVVVAPAPRAAQQALYEVHPYVPGRPTAALAVRGVGRPGAAQHVKPTVAYPEQMLTSQGARRSRGAWFQRELLRLGRAHMASGRTGARAAQSSGSGPFTLPYKAAAIEVVVPYSHEFTVTGPQNRAQFQPCGWNQTTYNAWCGDTWYWKQQSGGDVTAGCQWFLDNGYYTIDRDTVAGVTSEQNKDGAYTVEYGDFPNAFVQWAGHQCPQNGSQTGLLQGTDYYYALYEPPPADLHTLIVQTDPTVSAATSGTLWHDNQPNGSGATLEPDPFNPAAYGSDPRTLQETAWFLGRYTHSLSLTGQPDLSGYTFNYSGDNSFPNNEITYTSDSSSSSTSQGFNVGIFGDSGTGGYSRTDSISTSVTVTAPSWQVSPTPSSHAITYDWTTNDPVAWSTIASGGGGDWGLNKLNTADFSPSTLTVWSGEATCCQVSVASKRVLWLVDHYERWNGTDIENRFATKQLQFGDSPNEIPVKTDTKVAGPGIDLCDAQVMAPSFQTQCKGLDSPPTVNITYSCGTLPKTTGQFSFTLGGTQLGGTPPTPAGQPPHSFTCPHSSEKLGPITIAPDTAATIGLKPPPGASVNASIGCFIAGSEDPVVSSDIHGPLQVTVPADVLARGIPVGCSFFILPK